MRENRAQRKWRIDVREKRAAARWFPADRITQVGKINLGEMEILLRFEMLVDGFGKLIDRRKMNIAIGKIDRSTSKNPLREQF